MTTASPIRSLRSELTRAFWSFGALLVLVFLLVIATLSSQQEDLMLRRHVRLELEEYMRLHRDLLGSGATVLPPVTSPYISAYAGLEGIPEALRKFLVDLPEGIHGIEPGMVGGEDYFVAVRLLPDGVTKLYMVYDSRALDAWLDFARPSIFVLVVGVVAVTLLGSIAASVFSRRVLRPLTELEEMVSLSNEPRQLAEDLTNRSDPPELAALATTLAAAMQRLDAFVERERNFTRSASHELRTPVAVAQGAAELLTHNPGPDQAARLVSRIRRAVNQMEDLIETFLWLAREGEQDDKNWQTDLGVIVEDVVESHRPLLEGRPTLLELERHPTPTINAPPQVINVVIANLLKNALHATREGSVHVMVRDGEVRISDPGLGLDVHEAEPTGKAHGFGLSIVEELCRRYGWQANVTASSDGGTVANVKFTVP